MALLDFVGWDTFADPIVLTTYPNFQTSTNQTRVGGQFSGYAAAGAFGSTVYWYMPSNYTTLIFGFRCVTTSATIGANPIWLYVVDSAGTGQINLSVNTAGKLEIKNGATILGTGTSVLVPTSWYYVELKVTISNTVGAVELKLGGVTEINVTNVDTQATANANTKGVQFALQSVNAGCLAAIDDLYMCDDSGSAPHNTFLGMCRVDSVLATTNNSVTWTPLSSTNVSNIDDATPDDDTTYNSTTTSGAIDTFNHGALPVTPTSVFGVSVTSKIRKDDAAARSARNKLISGATTSNGTSVSLGTSYTYIKDIWALNPDGSTAWNKTTVDATKIGYEHV